MHLTRVLATLTGGSVVISLGGHVPEFWPRLRQPNRRAVKTRSWWSQLTGGNDGLNNVVPHNHAEYAGTAQISDSGRRCAKDQRHYRSIRRPADFQI